MSKRVWLIGGTSDSAALAQMLSAKAVPYVVTVTTPSARSLYSADTDVHVGVLNPAAMADFVSRLAVGCVLDASHPFASEVSNGAIALCQKCAIAYIRYERPNISAVSVDSVNQHQPDMSSDGDLDKPLDGASVIEVDSIDTLLERDILQQQRVLLTLGYRNLHKFSALRPGTQLFARVLPSVEAIDGARRAGFSAKEIIALRPPVLPALEAALWQHWGITCVVAKASGLPGGEDTKRQLAQQLRVCLILIRRPQLTYPAQTNIVENAVDFCVKTLSLY